VNHIPFHQLTDYACDRIADRQQRQAIMVHVHSCDECRQRLAIAWQIAERAQRTTADQPSPSLVQRVLKAARRQSTNAEAIQLPVVLLHDSKLDAVAPGLRGALRDRELLFAFGRFDLHLSILRADDNDSYTVLGQLLTGEANSCDVEGSRVALLQEGAALRTVLADHLGRFRISRLTEGEYGLHIATAAVETVVESFSIQL
jgi:hypothetical protein